jgi:acyl-CoA dehydrogenase
LQGVRTTAKREGDDYVINGSKTLITNGQHCDMVIVVARTNLEVSGVKGTTLFLVDTTTPGFQRGRNLEKIGLYASDTSELFFEDVLWRMFACNCTVATITCANTAHLRWHQ